ncbi:class III extradiol dioxygenase subunit B-like domain-containing protein [Streptomyces sp. B93]|uniref:class III extradiol dioxygenase subunit B-like domain-containing protein n=1 Tax=Streptomyces sp. B93 TaxID=2824875 RepID=UPI001B358DF3|nr:class III extradiol dioxygenase subunit B-like domain-containing protein [Streptomyces sp. B93]MBQ1089848.1 class III extradiol dioxygenase subunit B-like domain-containing protein [Streptomyces sp. B93]
MLVAAAVCPCPPLLVPEVAAGAAPELDAARAACTDALGVLAAARPDLLVVVGPDDGDAGADGTRSYAEGTPGSFRGFGVDADVRLGADGEPDAGAVTLPASLAVGAWLLERTGWADAPMEGLGLREPIGAERCIQVGRAVAARAGRVAMLVMADASACRTLKAPGYLDERAEPFDREVARALGAADIAALKALDGGLARELKASGRAGWQVLAGAGEEAGLTGALLYEGAPYGVGYIVATWS